MQTRPAAAVSAEKLIQILGDTPNSTGVIQKRDGWVVPMARKPSGGRPSKGDRDSIITRPMRPLGNEIRARADAAGMTISEYVAMVLANAHGMPQYAPVPSPMDAQGVLPLGRTA